MAISLLSVKSVQRHTQATKNARTVHTLKTRRLHAVTHRLHAVNAIVHVRLAVEQRQHGVVVLFGRCDGRSGAVPAAAAAAPRLRLPVGWARAPPAWLSWLSPRTTPAAAGWAMLGIALVTPWGARGPGFPPPVGSVSPRLPLSASSTCIIASGSFP